MSFKKIFFIFFVNTIFSSSIDLYSNEPYVVGEDGIIRMYVNVIGNVKNPGTYFVYDGIDILSVISIAGGYLDGSKLNRISISNPSNKTRYFDLNDVFDNNSKASVELIPYDTIYIEQKSISKILTSTNLPYVILGILNVILTLDQNNN